MASWFTRAFDRMCEASWDRASQRKQKLSEDVRQGINMVAAGQAIMKNSQEIDMNTDGRISFELTPAVGGHILTVARRNTPKPNSGLMSESSLWEKTTYVIAKGEDLGGRISKIINLEVFK